MACRVVAIALAALGAVALNLSCQVRSGVDRPSDEPPERIILVTWGSLRADMVGALGATTSSTPGLDAFAEHCQWVGSSIAASSSPVTSVASLMTGVDPWQHQLLSHQRAAFRRDLPTLASTLAAQGYRTIAIGPRRQRLASYGLLDAFDTIEEIDQALDPAAGLDQMLASISALGDNALGDNDLGDNALGNNRVFVWLDLPAVGFPFFDRSKRMDGLPPVPGNRPRVTARTLMPFADPELALTDLLRRQVLALYRHEVAWGDRGLASILDLLQQHPAWPRTAVAITALHGTEIGEHGQILHGQNVERTAIEVPLLLRLPATPHLDRSTSPVAAARLWSTLIEAAGGDIPPVHPPPLTRSSRRPALASLYLHNGVNQFTAVERRGDDVLQLIWTSRFLDPQAEYYRAQTVVAGAPRAGLREPPRRLFGRLRSAFERTPPLTGRRADEIELRLLRWLADGSVETLDQPAVERQMAADLRAAWLRFNTPEQSLRPTHPRTRR